MSTISNGGVTVRLLRHLWRNIVNGRFAPGYQREEETGWILFPKDAQFRKSLFFPAEVNEHPAKMNLHLQQAIIEYTAKEKDIILDPFGGTGSLMIAALRNIYVILIELEEGYHLLQQRAREELDQQIPGAGDLITLIHGDSQLILPIPCNHIITSPPYARALHQRTVRKGDADDEFVKMDMMINKYSLSSRNIGGMDNFLYNQNMEK